jgi:hypothetical protein
MSADEAPVTAEGLRERIEAALRSTWDGQPTHMDDAIRIETDAVLAALAGDPGDLPARMAEALTREHYRRAGERIEASPEEHSAAMAGVAMSVRWEDHAATLARLVAAEARAEHAEGELSSRRYHNTRWELERARADKAEFALKRVRRAVIDSYGEDYAGEDTASEVERLFRHLGEHDANVQRILQAKNEAIEKAYAERDALKAQLAEIAMAKVWTNEDGKRFVFADDLAAILLPELHTPATP